MPNIVYEDSDTLRVWWDVIDYSGDQWPSVSRHPAVYYVVSQNKNSAFSVAYSLRLFSNFYAFFTERRSTTESRRRVAASGGAATAADGDRRRSTASDHLLNLALKYGTLRHVFMYGWRTGLRFFFDRDRDLDLPFDPFFLPPQRDGAEEAGSSR